MSDFNIIRQDNERRGGRPRPTLAMEEFNDWVDACGLLEMRFSRQSLSWCNEHAGLSRSWTRLDRVFLNAATLDSLPDAYMKYLPRTSSNHAPMLILLEAKLESCEFPSFKF